MQDGQIVMADAIGYLDGTKETPVTTDTLYNIASISKVYCAAAVMQLVEEGKVDLDEPLVTYLPKFKMQDERYKDITVRMLLNHSCAITGSSYILGAFYGEYDEDVYEKEYAAFELTGLDDDPGVYSVYCNEGFSLAEILVVEVSGEDYSDYIRDHIFNVIGATSSGYADRDFEPGTYAMVGSYPHEYVNFMGTGGISSNLADLCKFGQIFLDKGQGVISEKSVEEMSSPQGVTFIQSDGFSPNYGFGWDSVNNPFDKYDFGEGVLAKNGGSNQFLSQLYVIPKYNMVCAISATIDFSGSVANVLSEIAADVLKAQGIDVTKAATPAAENTPQPLPQTFKEEYEGTYGAFNNIMRVTVNADDSISTSQLTLSGYVEKDPALYYNGSTFVDESGQTEYKFVQADGKKYLMHIFRSMGVEYPIAQKLESSSVGASAWDNRTEVLYLPSNVDLRAVLMASGFILHEDDTLPGILICGQGEEFCPLSIQNDDATQLLLQIPGSMGCDLYTLRTKTVNDEEWLYTEYYDLRPANALDVLQPGTVTIGEDGYNALYQLPADAITCTLPEGGRVVVYNSTGVAVFDSVTVDTPDFSTASMEGYIRFLGGAGTSFAVTAE